MLKNQRVSLFGLKVCKIILGKDEMIQLMARISVVYLGIPAKRGPILHVCDSIIYLSMSYHQHVTQNAEFDFESYFYAQVQQEEDQGVVCTANGGLTLRRLAVWMCEPLVRLKILAALVDVCEGCIQ
jgi:hypothetical protein